jgi:hypothetical protein
MKRSSLISLIFVGLLSACSGMAGNTASREAAQERLAKAEAMFQERCKKSGVFIYRTAENVEGILLLKLRPKGINRGDQYKMDDPYGSDSTGENYILFFISQSASAEVPEKIRRNYLGYRYVDAIDPQDGKRYRYTGSVKIVGQHDINAESVQRILKNNPNYDINIYRYILDRIPVSDPAPRFGVTYEDISTREERDYWIAGSSLKVIDLQTKEVMAERIGYMMDPSQGNNSGGQHG